MIKKVKLKSNVRHSAAPPLLILKDYLDGSLDVLPPSASVALVSPFGENHWLGPILAPPITACLNCFTEGLRENNILPRPQSPPDKARERATLSGMAAWLQEWTAGKEQGEAHILERDFAAGRETRHWVRRRSACHICGNECSSPLDFRRLTSEITGICSPVSVRRMGPLWIARSSQQIRHSQGPTPLVAGKRAPVLGRGFSRNEAISGCLAEAVERYCLYRSGTEQIVRASFRELGEEAIHPARLLLFSDRQYGGRQLRNRSGATPYWVPPRFDEHSPTGWILAEPLSGGEAKLVPANYCFFGSRPDFCVANSNGCGAGATKEEAILSGLLELIERDAVAIWWYNRIRRRPGIDWTNLPEFAGLREFLARHNRTVWSFDITTDIGIPVTVALSASTGGGQILMGAACHPDPAQALRSAVSEACQMLVGMNREGRVPLDDFPGGEDWLNTATVNTEPFLEPSHSSSPLPPSLPTTPLLPACLSALEARGLQAYAVDLTRAEFGLHVVRILVPGLRFWVPRFAPGRLFDVPVAMDWLAEANPEDRLNEWPWFL